MSVRKFGKKKRETVGRSSTASQSRSSGQIESLTLWQKIKILLLLNKTWKELKNMKSWKTTLGGVVTALGFALLKIDPDHAGLDDAIGDALIPVGALITAIFARDNNVSSEEARAK